MLMQWLIERRIKRQLRLASQSLIKCKYCLYAAREAGHPQEPINKLLDDYLHSASSELNDLLE